MRSKTDQNGFTIIELMVATVVFSFILLIFNMGVIKIYNIYYKGQTQTKTQDTARAVLDSLAQDIQFGGKTIPTPSNTKAKNANRVICVDNIRYTYKMGLKLLDNNISHAIVRDVASAASTPAYCDTGTVISNFNFAPLVPSAVELLVPNMRVALLQLTQPDPINKPTIYNIHIRLIYGDDDLLCSPSHGDCSSGGSGYNTDLFYTFLPDDLGCKSTAGSQFCAVADLTTTVDKRVR